MPFQYRPHQNRYVGSITDLMGRGGDAEAQALTTAANAQAQAAQASGQAWGGAIQGIGNTIAAIPGQMQAQQDRARVVEQQERADQARALRADIFSATPGHTIGPVIPEGTKLSPTTPGAAVEGPGSMAGDWGVATGLELPNRYRTTDANGSVIFDREQIIATFAAAGLDPPDMSPYTAINQEITGRFTQSLQHARGIARSLLEGPAGAWEQGLSTALGVFEANGLLPAQMLSSMRAQLRDIESLPAAEKETRLGQLLHQLTGDETPEAKFVSADAVRVKETPWGDVETSLVTAPGDRPRGRPTPQSVNGELANVWYGTDGVPRDESGKALVGDIQPASAATRTPTPGSIMDLAVTELRVQEERLGRALTWTERRDAIQGVHDRKEHGPALAAGEMPAEKIDRLVSLSNLLKAEPVYQEIVEIGGAWQALQAAHATSNTGLSDIAMINSFQRMIDPGVSVREGDVALMNQAQGVFDRLDIEFVGGQLTAGSQLSPPQRARMMALGRAIYAAKLEGYRVSVEPKFERFSTASGVPFDMIRPVFPDSGEVVKWDDED